jgi:hypothetical protein
MLMAERLELPRLPHLLPIVGWNLAEAFGLPVVGYVVGTLFWGRNAGLLAMLAAIWIMAVVRKFVTRSVPALIWISAAVLTLQAVAAIATGNLWVFLVHFPIANFALAILFAVTARGHSPLAGRLAEEVIGLPQQPRQPALHRFFQDATWVWAGIFLVLAATLGALLTTVPVSTYVAVWAVTTIGLLGAGAAASVLWFRAVLRRAGITLAFAPAAAVDGNGNPGPGECWRRRIFPIRPPRLRARR